MNFFCIYLIIPLPTIRRFVKKTLGPLQVQFNSTTSFSPFRKFTLIQGLGEVLPDDATKRHIIILTADVILEYIQLLPY